MPPSNALSVPKLVLPGAALLLLISSFLPWYHISMFGVSAGASGWHQIGVVAWLLTIVLVAYEGARLAGVVPLDAAKADLATVGIAALTLLFGIIYVIVRLSDGAVGFGLWIGVIAMVGVGVGAFLTLQSGGAKTAFEDLRNQAQQNQGGTPPPPPPSV
jgi:hypothetical protein